MRKNRTIERDGESETEKQGTSLRADLVTGYFSHNHSRDVSRMKVNK